MKLCFPIESENGVQSLIYSHFGSAPMFIIHDTESNVTVTINNQNLGHEHGMCSPIKALNGKSVDAIIVGGIGAGAISKLNAMGIKVFRSNEGTIQENVELFKNNSLSEITLNDACRQHGSHQHS